MQISVITLGTRDQRRAIAFYSTLLDCAPVEDRSGVAYFKLQGSSLALYPREALARYCGVEDHDPRRSAPPFRAVTLSVNVASQSEVDALVARARDAGARIVQPANKAGWGGYVAWIADADEHLWEFVFNPQRTQTDPAA